MAVRAPADRGRHAFCGGNEGALERAGFFFGVFGRFDSDNVAGGDGLFSGRTGGDGGASGNHVVCCGFCLKINCKLEHNC